jgi:hypothetical protein
VVPEAVKAAWWDWYHGWCTYEEYVNAAMASLETGADEDQPGPDLPGRR